MEVKLICVGKKTASYLREGEGVYTRRLKHYIRFSRVDVPDVKQTKKMTVDQLKEEETKAILKHIKPGERVFLLDEKGRSFTSEKWANFLQKQFLSGGQGLVFVVGGAFGFSKEMYEKATGKIALSEMTFSHQMVRLFFMEQLYRGMTILKGEPYHNS